MNRKILLILLAVAAVIELFLSLAGLFFPAWMLEQFELTSSPDVLFLAHALAWLLLLVTLICGYAFLLVKKREPIGLTISFILGFWWMGIGGSLFVFFHRPEHLVLDLAKGAAIALLAWRARQEKS